MTMPSRFGKELRGNSKSWDKPQRLLFAKSLHPPHPLKVESGLKSCWEKSARTAWWTKNCAPCAPTKFWNPSLRRKAGNYWRSWPPESRLHASPRTQRQRWTAWGMRNNDHSQFCCLSYFEEIFKKNAGSATG